MDHSRPNPWLYGGVLERIEWNGAPATVKRWDTKDEPIRAGETLLVMRTPAWAQVIGVEQA